MERLRSNKPLSCNNSKHLYVYLAKLRNNNDPQKSFFLSKSPISDILGEYENTTTLLN